MTQIIKTISIITILVTLYLIHHAMFINRNNNLTITTNHLQQSESIRILSDNIDDNTLDPIKGNSISSYHKVKAKLEKLLSLIYNRYEMNQPYGYQLFMASNNINSHSWEIIKMKFAVKMLSENATFLMVFTGSSVTAGHDNYYNQSYPSIVMNRLSNIFSKLGIELIVRNIALGANPCYPYVFCYESMGGSDPDFINWEQSYNCGRDTPIFETAMRIAGRSKNKG